MLLNESGNLVNIEGIFLLFMSLEKLFLFFNKNKFNRIVSFNVLLVAGLPNYQVPDLIMNDSFSELASLLTMCSVHYITCCIDMWTVHNGKFILFMRVTLIIRSHAITHVLLGSHPPMGHTNYAPELEMFPEYIWGENNFRFF